MRQTSYELNMVRPDLPEGTLKLAFLTDLHNAENGSGNSELLQAIRSAAPDLILCGGDMMVGRENLPAAVPTELLSRLAAEYPVYHGMGNHETKLKNTPQRFGTVFQEYEETLSDAGVVFLDNRQEQIAVRGIPVRIAGYTLPKEAYKRLGCLSLKAEQLNRSLGSPDPRSLNILLAHHPEYMKAYSRWGADLTLCGHYHGGMVRLGKHTGLITPNLKLFSGKCCGVFDFPACSAGEAEGKFTSHAIVSAGLGEHTVPIRFHDPRELVIVELHLRRAVYVYS